MFTAPSPPRLLEDALPQLLGHLAHDSVKNGERTADMPAIPAGLHDPRGPLSGFAVPAKEATKAPGEVRSPPDLPPPTPMPPNLPLQHSVAGNL